MRKALIGLCMVLALSVVAAARAASTTSLAGGPAVAAAREWTKLFADEKWYKDLEAKEETFAGTLEAVPDADKPGILMRTSYYKLGDRTIYTVAKKVKVLDDLVGKKVEFLGKPFGAEIEGKAISEIWPAAVRAAE